MYVIELPDEAYILIEINVMILYHKQLRYFRVLWVDFTDEHQALRQKPGVTTKNATDLSVAF